MDNLCNMQISNSWTWICLLAIVCLLFLGYFSLKNYLKKMESVLTQTKDWEMAKNIYRN